MLRLFALAALVWCWGCLDFASSRCPSGLSCPAGTLCVADICATPEQLAVCDYEGSEDKSCQYSGLFGECRDGLCQQFVCGNGVREAGEQCDGLELESCLDYGFDRGRTACAACATDPSTCGRVGWETRGLSGASLFAAAVHADGRKMAVAGTLDGGPVVLISPDGTAEGFAPVDLSALDVSGISDLAFDGDDLWAVGAGGFVGVWNGTDWAIDDQGDQNWIAVSYHPVGGLLAIASSGEFLHRPPNGSEMLGVTGQGTGIISEVAWTTGDSAYAVGKGGTVIRYQDGGWSAPIDVGITLDLYSIAVRGEQVVVGGGGIVLEEIDGSWQPVDPPVPAGLGIIGVALGEDELFGLAVDVELLQFLIIRLDRTGWATELRLSAPASALVSGPKRAVVAGERGLTVRYEQSWLAPNAEASFLDVAVSESGVFYPNNLLAIWQPEELGLVPLPLGVTLWTTPWAAPDGALYLLTRTGIQETTLYRYFEEVLTNRDLHPFDRWLDRLCKRPVLHWKREPAVGGGTYRLSGLGRFRRHPLHHRDRNQRSAE